MARWSQENIHTHMQVYSSDSQSLGKIAKVYEDSFLIHEGSLLKKKRYIPYSAIAHVNGDQVQLAMSAAEVSEKEWEMRPNYEDHLGDPLQLFYDRGHGIHDPFDETNPDRA